MERPPLASPALRPEWLAGEIAVVGLARSGKAAAQLLARAGARVYASDFATDSDLEATARILRDEGVEVQLGGHDMQRLARASLVVASPGVPPDAPPFVSVGSVVQPDSTTARRLRRPWLATC